MPAMKLRRNDQCLICPCHGHAHFDPNVEKTSALGRQRTRMQSQHPHRMAPGSMDTESCLLDVRCLPSLNKQRCARRCMDGILKICKSKDTQWQTIGESILDGDCHRAQLQSLPTDVDSMNTQGLAGKTETMDFHAKRQRGRNTKTYPNLCGPSRKCRARQFAPHSESWPTEGAFLLWGPSNQILVSGNAGTNSGKKQLFTF